MRLLEARGASIVQKLKMIRPCSRIQSFSPALTHSLLRAGGADMPYQ